MNRSVGLLLIGIGALGIAIGVFFLLAFVDDPQYGLVAIVTFLIGGGLGGAMVLLGAISMRGRKALGNRTEVKSRTLGYLDNEVESRSRDGIQFDVQYSTAKRGRTYRQAFLKLRMAAATPTKLSFQKETWWDRLGTQLGIARRFQTGDVAFDKAVYVRGPSEAFAGEYLAGSERRAAIVGLIRSGFSYVGLSGSHAEAGWMHFNPTKHDRPNLLDDAVKHLNVLAITLPPADPAFAAARDRTLPIYKFLTVSLILFALTGAAVWAYPPIRGWDLLVAALKPFFVVYGLFGLLAALLLRGASQSHDRWAPLMVVGFFAIGLGSIGSFAAINALSDGTAGDERVFTVMSKKNISMVTANEFHAIIPAWDRPGTLKFKVSASDFERIVPERSQLKLLVGPGRFGIEWLKSQRVLP